MCLRNQHKFARTGLACVLGTSFVKIYFDYTKDKFHASRFTFYVSRLKKIKEQKDGIYVTKRYKIYGKKNI